jgi:branched-chain amino acid transport system substrate-binding protein
MYLFEVKKPEESKGPWDYYKQLATIPAEEAWRPLDQGTASDPLTACRSELWLNPNLP